MNAVPAGAVVAPSRVETRTVAVGEAVRVLVTCHDPDASISPDGRRTTHLLAPSGARYASESASVVVADGRGPAGHDGIVSAHDLLYATARQYPGALVAGVVTGSRSALVWVRVQPPSVWVPVGYSVTVRSTGPGPAELYPSAVYGWARWWLEQQSDIPSGFPVGLLLPRPPRHLDVVAQWDARTSQYAHRLTVEAATRPGE
ncbi:hypothetical protein [Streptomyces sp. NPDC057617]|uniref:hypothetical protein n=1 Tax=Streptomyces sp. NPDC057617 TaxID=3346184 RepID=UPI0036875B51